MLQEHINGGTTISLRSAFWPPITWEDHILSPWQQEHMPLTGRTSYRGFGTERTQVYYRAILTQNITITGNGPTNTSSAWHCRRDRIFTVNYNGDCCKHYHHLQHGLDSKREPNLLISMAELHLCRSCGRFA